LCCEEALMTNHILKLHWPFRSTRLLLQGFCLRRKKKPRTLGRTPGAKRKPCGLPEAALPAPEQSPGWLPSHCLINHSGKGSPGLLTLLQRRDHARLQTPFGDLQVTVQAIYQIDQQALFLQLTLANRAPQGNAGNGIVNGQLAITAGISNAELCLIGSQGVVEQFADSFHPVHSLRGGI